MRCSCLIDQLTASRTDSEAYHKNSRENAQKERAGFQAQIDKLQDQTKSLQDQVTTGHENERMWSIKYMRQCQLNITLKHEIQHHKQANAEHRLEIEDLRKWHDEYKKKALSMRGIEQQNLSLKSQLKDLANTNLNTAKIQGHLERENVVNSQNILNLERTVEALNIELASMKKRLDVEDRRNLAFQTSLANERRKLRGIQDRLHTKEDEREQALSQASRMETALKKAKAERAVLDQRLEIEEEKVYLASAVAKKSVHQTKLVKEQLYEERQSHETHANKSKVDRDALEKRSSQVMKAGALEEKPAQSVDCSQHAQPNHRVGARLEETRTERRDDSVFAKPKIIPQRVPVSKRSSSVVKLPEQCTDHSSQSATESDSQTQKSASSTSTRSWPTDDASTSGAKKYRLKRKPTHSPSKQAQKAPRSAW